jgi:hypothetical protein
MPFQSTHSFSFKEFLLTPLSRSQGQDQFTAVLSIRRGKGSQTHDRVYAFKPQFKTQASALKYAIAQGHRWMLHPESLV